MKEILFIHYCLFHNLSQLFAMKTIQFPFQVKTLIFTVSLFSIFLYTPSFAQQGMGVGNTNPLEMLDISGAIKIGTDINNTNTAPIGGAGTIRFKLGQFEGWNGTLWVPLSGGSGDTDWTIAGNNQYSAVSGNVGIGTSTPNAKLHVYGGVDKQVKVDVTARPKVEFEGTNGGSLNAVNFNLDLCTNNLPRISVTNVGNVGIGTTTPDRLMNVESATGPQLLFTRNDGNTTNDELMGELLFDNNSNSSSSSVDAAVVIRANAFGTQGNSNKGGYLAILTKNNTAGTATATERMRIAANGNVGIGESAPSATLDVVGTAQFNIGTPAAGKVLTSIDALGNIAWSDPNSLVGVNDDDWTGGGTGNMYATDLADEVGIGRTNPRAKLEVVSDVDAVLGTNASGIFRVSSASGNANLLMDVNDIMARVGNINAGTLNLQREGGVLNVGDGNVYVESAGNVGVATTTPRALLELFSDEEAVLGTNASGIFRINKATGNANLLMDVNDIMARASNTNPTTLNLQREGGDLDVGNGNVYMTSNALVGIGTNSPNYRLHINRGSGNDVFSQFTNSSTGATSSDGLLIGINSNGHAQLFQQDAFDIRFATDNVERMTIEADGEVGIATNNPRALLEIVSNSDATLATATSGVFRISRTTASTANLLMDSDDIMARATNTTAGTLNLQREGGDLDVSDGLLYVKDANHRVGVGTTSPRAILELSSDVDAVLGTNASGIFRINSATGSANLLMDTDDIMARSSNTSPGTLNLQRQNGDLDVGNGNLYVKSNGRFGIKTNTPNYSLQVNSTGFGVDTYSQFTSDGTGTGADNGLLVGVNWAGTATIMQQSFEDLRFGTNDATRMTITDDGNVGIGTTSPLSLFEVRGAGIDKTYGSNTGNYVAIFENTNATGADGIAIQIENNNADAENNFVTFVDGLDRIAGRIEGFQDYDWENPPTGLVPQINLSTTESTIASFMITNLFEPLEIPDIVIGSQLLGSVNIPNFNVNLPSINLPDLDLSSVSLGVWSLGSINPPAVSINLPNLNLPNLPSFTIPGFTLPGTYVPAFYNDISSGQLPVSYAEIEALMCWGVENNALDMVTMDPTELAMMGMKIAARQICNDGGVTYASKGADYAEWIPKENATQHFNIGEIVGVKNGRISKSTEDAEQIMIVSSRPIVLGNTPPAGEADAYAKVGFMGQVLTIVKGEVNVGDYIIPSGYNDGIAKAVSPEDIRLD